MTVHLAAAGGGSAGFGGFHGGGGGGGKGFALYILLQLLFRIALFGHGLGAAVLVGAILLWLLLTRVVPGWRAARAESGPAARRSTARRERRVELAAAEAADDEEAFAPERVRSEAAALFNRVQGAWDAGDRLRLGQLVAPRLLREWERRLDDFERRGWRNRVQVIGTPAVQYVSLTRNGDDRVVVRVEAKLRDFVEDRYGNRLKRAGRLSESVRVREFWTLVKREGRWMLGSVEQGGEGSHALTDKLVPTPWADEQAVRDEAFVEGAVADAAPSVAEVASVDYAGDARGRALDLSVADGRFAPEMLEIAARRTAAAWAQAVDGDDSGLRAIARDDAIQALLHPSDRTRLVIRGPRVEQIRIVGLDPSADPPTLTLDVTLAGRRYLEDRDTTQVLAGSKSRETSFTEHWTLALDGDDAGPWRLAAVGAPLARA
jgi:predicted lipid-binding transport protein (Tim44 family)